MGTVAVKKKPGFWERWWLRILLIFIAIIIGVVIAFFFEGFRLNVGPWGLKFYDKGAAYPAALQAAFSSGPVQNDLTNKGLVSTDSSGETTVNLGNIEGLIAQGIYFINPQNHMEIGPVSVPGQVLQFAGTPGYRYSQRVTQLWGTIDDFSFIGHSVSVTIPAKADVPANGQTTHNLYNTHLTLPDGHWVESGVGWVNWTTGPIIYTYQNYTSQWSIEKIPEGTSRDILLKIEVSADQVAEMSVSDPLSGKTVHTTQKVTDLGHRVDLTQEQHSYSDQWIATPKARFHDNQIKKKGSTQWENWDSSTYTTWMYNPPLQETRGTENNQIWTDTWSQP